MDFDFQTLISICIINSFLCFVIYFTLSKKNNKKLLPKFFGLFLDKSLNSKKGNKKIILEKGYYLHINNILNGDFYEHESLILKVKTNRIKDYIYVYNGNPSNWKPYIDLKFGEEDEYIIFEYNNRVFLSGTYIPI